MRCSPRFRSVVSGYADSVGGDGRYSGVSVAHVGMSSCGRCYLVHDSNSLSHGPRTVRDGWCGTVLALFLACTDPSLFLACTDPSLFLSGVFQSLEKSCLFDFQCFELLDNLVDFAH